MILDPIIVAKAKQFQYKWNEHFDIEKHGFLKFNEERLKSFTQIWNLSSFTTYGESVHVDESEVSNDILDLQWARD